MIPTSVLAQQWQINLKKSELAPFDGVLVPHETYRKQDELNREFDLNKEELRNCLNKEEVKDPRGFEFIAHGITFTVGVAAGIGGVLLLKEVLK